MARVREEIKGGKQGENEENERMKPDKDETRADYEMR
jgi:hypothetical protein